jgi:hypothetical protein
LTRQRCKRIQSLSELIRRVKTKSTWVAPARRASVAPAKLRAGEASCVPGSNRKSRVLNLLLRLSCLSSRRPETLHSTGLASWIPACRFKTTSKCLCVFQSIQRPVVDRGMKCGGSLWQSAQEFWNCLLTLRCRPNNLLNGF